MKRLMALIFGMSLVIDAAADTYVTGTVARAHVGSGNVAVFLTSTSGCSSQWYYMFRTDFDADTWKSAVALVLVAYAQGKTVTLFTTPNSNICTDQRFQAIDTIN